MYGELSKIQPFAILCFLTVLTTEQNRQTHTKFVTLSVERKQGKKRKTTAQLPLFEGKQKKEMRKFYLNKKK